MDSNEGDWSVVTPKKEKKSSPKAQKKKGLKRTDLQRSVSSNQIANRRKTATDNKEDYNNKPNKAITRSSKIKQTGNDSQSNANIMLNGNTAAVQEALSTIIEEVSSKIQYLNINEKHFSSVSDKGGRSNATFTEMVGVNSTAKPKLLDSVEFCTICRTFSKFSDQSARSRFQTRCLQMFYTLCSVGLFNSLFHCYN